MIVIPLEMPVIKLAAAGGPEQLRIASGPVQGFYAPPPGASGIPGSSLKSARS